MEEKAKIPVTIITGFLGSGKTTLLNRFIREYPDKKFAIIENEFGEIGLDSELIIGIDNSNICELANGCICCSLNDDLAALLKDLLRSGKSFNHLLVETTGIADPSTVVQVFFSDFEVKTRYMMDAVICMVDALNFTKSLKEGREAREQVCMSDIVLLNKVDLATPEMINASREFIQEINPHAGIIESRFGGSNGSDLLGTCAYETESIVRYALDVNRWQDGKQDRHSIGSYSYVFPGDFDIEKFSFWMEYFLSINQSSILRIKGILSFSGNPHKMVLQSVRSSYLLDDGEFWDVGEERMNRLVITGRDLDFDEIGEALKSLM
jgi:G3E family GTPase